MDVQARLRASFTSLDERTPSARRGLAALTLALALGCGGPGEPGTSETTGEPTTTGDASTGVTGGPTTGGSSSGGTGSGASGDATTAETDATTGDSGTCAQLCQRTSGCTGQGSLEQCVADCEASDDALRDCVAACDQATCEELLMCTSLCAHEGDPNATPYAICEDSASTCQPGVYLCIHSAHDGLEFSVCAPFCDADDECPTPATGTATPQCDLTSRPNLCSLDCSGGQQCPDDMVCDLQGSGLCMWPAG